MFVDCAKVLYYDGHVDTVLSLDFPYFRFWHMAGLKVHPSGQMRKVFYLPSLVFAILNKCNLQLVLWSVSAETAILSQKDTHFCLQRLNLHLHAYTLQTILQVRLLNAHVYKQENIHVV